METCDIAFGDLSKKKKLVGVDMSVRSGGAGIEMMFSFDGESGDRKVLDIPQSEQIKYRGMRLTSKRFNNAKITVRCRAADSPRIYRMSISTKP